MKTDYVYVLHVFESQYADLLIDKYVPFIRVFYVSKLIIQFVHSTI